MVLSDNVQTFSAVFSFGLLLQAATSALLIYLRGHASTIFRDRSRLALVVFLISAALWAQIEFLNFLVPRSRATLCQATIFFSTTFDQVARASMGGFLLWAVGHGTRSAAEKYGLGTLLGLRTISGLIFVGFARPQYAPVCVARSDLLPLSIVVVTLDGIIIGILVIQVLQLRMSNNPRNSQSNKDHHRALTIATVGYFIWTATSITMILGLETIMLLLRTTIPSTGLFVLVGALTILEGPLLSFDMEVLTSPEARSPFVVPPPRTFQERQEGDGSPVTGHRYTNSGTLFVVNPSDTPADSPLVFPGGGFKGEKSPLGYGESRVVINSREVGASASGPSGSNLIRSSNGIFQNAVNMAETDSPTTKLRAPTYTLPPQVSSPKIQPVMAPTAQQKRSLFNRGKAPVKQSIRSLGISQPIMEVDENSESPFARMKTVDLATAAEEEKARRKAATDANRLIADRPAPQPPIMKPTEGFWKSVGVKNEESSEKSHKSKSSISSTVSSSSSKGKSMEVNGTSTSASLSPGRDEVRRRSPRNSKSFEAFDEKHISLVPSMPNTPLIGRPSQPRANVPSNPRPVANSEPQRIMFVKDIVYDEPNVVQSIIDKATTPSKPWTKAQEYNLHSADSMIHRPRPYRRNTEEDRVIFPSEPHHRRTKSGGSIFARKSNLYIDSGSPAGLPSLPPPPTSAAALKKLLPKDTKSMTVDEKIQLLFPAPPDAPKNRRRSSVPAVPRIPSAILAAAKSSEAEDFADMSRSRVSKRTTIPSIIDMFPPLVPTVPALSPDDTTYRFSPDTYRFVTEMDPIPWIPELPKSGSNRRSSLLEPHFYGDEDKDDDRSVTVSTYDQIASRTSFADTAWESLHSPLRPVNIGQTSRAAAETFVGGKKAELHVSSRDRELPSLPLEEENDDQQEFVTFMLDPSEAASITSQDRVIRESFILGIDQSLPATPDSSIAIGSAGSTWHRRVGDELPTFSDRQGYRKARAMPPPAPLLLSKNGRQATVVVLSPEPASMTTPERAIAEIQEQLKKFEHEPSRGSVGSLLRRIPAGTPGAAEDQENLSRLLENLEQEMGQQESQWMRMQQNLDRNSSLTSGMISPPPEMNEAESQPGPSHVEQQTSRSSRSVSRRARIRSTASKNSESLLTTSTISSEASRASVWQRRLAEAQMEYLEHAPALLNNRAAPNFLSVAKDSTQLGSPTPPESVESCTDIDTEFENDDDVGMATARPYIKKELPNTEPITLWQATLKPLRYDSERLWSPPYRKKSAHHLPQPPAQPLRPAKRILKHSLEITSMSLWSKTPTPSVQLTPGLWRSRPVRPTVVTKKTAQKPERKSKRMTFLPDILESPEPLPNKRDTLGIFQFPWGERSDNVVSQPLISQQIRENNFPFVNNPPQLRFEMDSEMSEYESSFFDDYDEDFVDDEEESDDDFHDSEDEFDESTLWEIANMLNSGEVPSRNSLFPPRQSVIEDYDNDDYDFNANYTESEEEFSDSPVTHPDVKLPIQPLTRTTYSRDLLWENQTEASQSVTSGLPQPESSVWQKYAPADDDVVRKKSRPESQVEVLESRDMWSSPEPSSPARHTFCLWKNRPSSIVQSPEVSSPDIVFNSKYLWSKGSSVEESSRFWLADSSIIAYPTTVRPVETPRPAKTRRFADAGLPVLTSNDLWINPMPSVEIGRSARRLWNQINIVRPRAPTVGKSAEPTSRDTRAFLWTPKTEEVQLVSTDFLQTSKGRPDFRLEYEIPAAISLVRAPRANNVALPILKSRELWQSSRQAVSIKSWIMESSVLPNIVNVEQVSSGASMWSAPEKQLWIDIPGLFDSRIPRCDFRTSSKEPAALTVIKAARKPDASLPVLESHRLWRKLKVIEIEHDWMTESSVRAISPSYSSDSDRSSILSETASIASASTKASSIWSTYNNVAAIAAQKPNWWESKSKRNDSPTPRASPKAEDQDRSKIPILKSQKPVKGPSRDSKILANRAMWESASPEPRFIPSFMRKSSIKSVPQADVSLERAVSKRQLNTKPRDLSHRGATPSQWASALEEALAKSNTSVINKDSHFNPAVRHPVFFASSMNTTASFVHPAATGYARGSAERSVELWVAEPADVVKSVADFTNLWTASPTVTHDRANLFDTKCEVTKRIVTAQASLPVLTSSTLWKAEKTGYVPEKNWILLSSKSLITVWTKPAVASGNAEGQLMWNAQVKGHSRQRSLFTDAMDKEVKRTSPKPTMDIPKLESTETWQPQDIANASRDWIRESVVQSVVPLDMPIASPRPTKPNQTWVAPNSLDALEALIDDDAMWKASEAARRRSPNLFSNMKPEPLKRTPSQKAHALTKLESDAFWQPVNLYTEKKDWIRVAVAPVANSVKFMWEPSARRTTKGPKELSLWKSPVAEKVEETTAFGNPHVGPWVKAKRALGPLKVIESRALWRPSLEGPQSPRDWLVTRND